MISRRRLSVVAVLVSALVPTWVGAAETKSRRLGAAEIRARISGHDLTDGVHWRRHFKPNGVLESIDLGEKSTGRWTIRSDRLCFAARKEDPLECYDVFAASATQIRLHVEDTGYDLEGTIEIHGRGRL